MRTLVTSWDGGQSVPDSWDSLSLMRVIGLLMEGYRCGSLTSLDSPGRCSYASSWQERSLQHRLGLREQELLGAQFLDRIAQLCRLLELKALGCFAHVAFQLRNVGVHFFLGPEFGHAFRF